MSTKIGPTILEHLTDLEKAVDEIANTWRPNDPQYRADIYRQIMMNLSYSYFAYFHADAEHPDWSPLWNPVYTHQPNPDDIYLYSPIRGDLKYLVKGNRGTVSRLIFSTQHGLSGLVNDLSDIYDNKLIDDRSIEIGPDGEFEILFSATRPEGHTGNWAEISPRADVMMIRYRMVDWVKERDPQLTIECLDPVPLKRRLNPDEIAARIHLMAGFPLRLSKSFLKMQNEIKQRVGVNTFEFIRYDGFAIQTYWPAVFELEEGEALIIETELPAVRPYWNIQLNDPYFGTVEYVYRLSSINAATAQISSDGKLRAVVALEDPGVPNWLDPGGFKQGTIYGRWYDCDTRPHPSLKRVKLAELRDYLPPDTPKVTLEERAEQLRARVRAAQRRRRW